MARRPQNQNNGQNRPKRPAYDQTRDARQTSSTRNGVRYSSGRRPVTNPNYDPDAPRPGTPNRSRSGGYPDNSIQFPTGGRVAQPSNANRVPERTRPQNRNQTRNPNRSNASNAARRNASNLRRNPPQAAARPRKAQQQPRSGQRLRPTQANLRDPARRESKKRRKLTRKVLRRRRAMRRLTALAMLLCVIAAGIYLTVTMLFKISAIQVRTADGIVTEAGGYTSEQIVQALGVHLEENIFSFDPKAKSAALEKVFPMLEFIQVERDYPGTVVIRVTEAEPAWAMQTKNGWLTLSSSLKILASNSAQPTGLPTLYGGEPVSAKPGDQLNFETDSAASSAAESESGSASAVEEPRDKRLESLKTLLDALDAAGMSADVTRIEFADPEEMTFLYQDRISVLLGTLNELDYKLKLAQHVLKNEDGKGCAATDTGTLDFTHISMSSTRKFTFAQGEPELPSGYTVPEPTEPATAEEPETDPETAAASDETAGDTAADPDAEAGTQTDATPAGAEPTDTENTN